MTTCFIAYVRENRPDSRVNIICAKYDQEEAYRMLNEHLGLELLADHIWDVYTSDDWEEFIRRFPPYTDRSKMRSFKNGDEFYNEYLDQIRVDQWVAEDYAEQNSEFIEIGVEEVKL